GMPAETVRTIGERGECAGTLLAARFASHPGKDPKTKKAIRLTWDNHRWIRYRTFMAAFELVGRKFGATWQRSDWPESQQTYPELLQEPPSYKLTAPQQQFTAAARGYGRLVDGIFRPSGTSCRRALAAAEADPARHAAGNKRPARRAGGLAALPADAKVARGWRRLPCLDGRRSHCWRVRSWGSNFPGRWRGSPAPPVRSAARSCDASLRPELRLRRQRVQARCLISSPH